MVGLLLIQFGGTNQLVVKIEVYLPRRVELLQLQILTNLMIYQIQNLTLL